MKPLSFIPTIKTCLDGLASTNKMSSFSFPEHLGFKTQYRILNNTIQWASVDVGFRSKQWSDTSPILFLCEIWNAQSMIIVNSHKFTISMPDVEKLREECLFLSALVTNKKIYKDTPYS